MQGQEGNHWNVCQQREQGSVCCHGEEGEPSSYGWTSIWRPDPDCKSFSIISVRMVSGQLIHSVVEFPPLSREADTSVIIFMLFRLRNLLNYMCT